MTGGAAAEGAMLLLMSLEGSHMIQSMQLGRASSSPLSNALISINCSPVDGLPTTRHPSDPTSDAIERFRVGGAVEECVWSPSERRLAVRFASKEEGAELVALFALNRDATMTYQTMTIGMIRGPGCTCMGRVHQQKRVTTTTTENRDREQDGNMESKYESKYPSLFPSGPPSPTSARSSSIARPCRERNLPVRMSFLNDHPHSGELLTIAYECGQIQFIPMYFALTAEK